MNKKMLGVLLTGIAALFLATGAAHAGPRVVGKPTVRLYFNWLPPAEYDKPFTGSLIIRRLEAEEDIERVCKGSSKVACAARVADGSACHLFIANDNVLRSHHVPWAFVLRHELGHCNGWTIKHETNRKAEIKGCRNAAIAKGYINLASLSTGWLCNPRMESWALQEQEYSGCCC